jgi:hypothetical protein
MPPIPVTLDEQTRLSTESLQRRINDLVKFQIPRLRQCTGPLAIQQRLNAEVRDDIDACTQQVEVNFSAIYIHLHDVEEGYDSRLWTFQSMTRIAS